MNMIMNMILYDISFDYEYDISFFFSFLASCVKGCLNCSNGNCTECKRAFKLNLETNQCEKNGKCVFTTAVKTGFWAVGTISLLSRFWVEVAENEN